MERPESLTVERAYSLLPKYDVNPDWQRKHDAGELPDGLHGMLGMLRRIEPAESPTPEEASYILSLYEQGSMRWVAGQLLGNDNQVFGSDLIDVARAVAGNQNASS